MSAALAEFFPGASPDPSSYDRLFLYFVEGFARHRSRLGALARFPGLRSSHGARADGLEGFARSAPLWGAWARSGRPRTVHLADGTAFDLASEFRRGLLAGTDPASPEYWGDVGDRDQRIVEAADVALALWLFRATVWDGLPDRDRARVARWLGQALGKETWDNNWHLFPVLVDAVLRSLGLPGDPAGAERHADRLLSFHRGEGWFSDGPGAVFDYYNAWGFHYGFAWLRRIDPSWEARIAGPCALFLATFRYLVGPLGFPVLGRSICYRMAVAAPLVLGQETDPGIVSPSQARRALDATWSFFVSRGALRNGTATQGYYGPDPRVLEDYSGPASPLWSTRSLTAAFSLPPGSAFWTGPAGRLPVEEESFRFEIGSIGWRVSGDRETGTIRVEVLTNPEAADGPLEPWRVRDRLAGFLLRTARRPENRKAKYGRRVYASDRPFCGGRAGPAPRRRYFLRV